MLPRITAALSQLIAPIASAKPRLVSDQEAERSRSFKRFSGKEKDQESQHSAEHSEAGESKSPRAHLELVETPSDQAKLKPAHTESSALAVGWTQLVTLFQRRGISIGRWLGARSYARISAKKLLRKGAILDHRAE